MSSSSRTLKSIVVGLSTGLFVAVSFLAIGDLWAAPPTPAGAKSSLVAYQTPSNQEGLRYVYTTMSPKKEALIERFKRDDRDLPKMKFKKLIDGKHPAVVRIDVQGKGNVVYHGSGTLVAVSEKQGLIITNWHVVRDCTGDIHVWFPDGFVAKAAVRKIDKLWDLAALAIVRPKAQPVKLSAVVPKVGDVLTIAGYGSGTYRYSTGRMLQFCAPDMKEPAEILEVTTGARSGDSGGPIFAQDETLAGVLFGSISGTTNGSHNGRVKTFLKPILAAAPFAKRPIAERTVSYQQEIKTKK